MSTLASVAVPPDVFAFSEENLVLAQEVIGRYPAERKQSAVIPLLDIAQRQNANWLPRVAMDYVADMLGMARIRVYEVATFYTMFNKEPVGKYHIQVCTTTPCWLRGAGDVVGACQRRLGIVPGETTPDGVFSLAEVECAGACANAPVVAIGDDYYEDVDETSMVALIDRLERGETPKAGSQIGRQGSCPAGGPTTLRQGEAISLPTHSPAVGAATVSDD